MFGGHAANMLVPGALIILGETELGPLEEYLETTGAGDRLKAVSLGNPIFHENCGGKTPIHSRGTHTNAPRVDICHKSRVGPRISSRKHHAHTILRRVKRADIYAERHKLHQRRLLTYGCRDDVDPIVHRIVESRQHILLRAHWPIVDIPAGLVHRQPGLGGPTTREALPEPHEARAVGSRSYGSGGRVGPVPNRVASRPVFSRLVVDRPEPPLEACKVVPGTDQLPVAYLSGVEILPGYAFSLERLWYGPRVPLELSSERPMKSQLLVVCNLSTPLSKTDITPRVSAYPLASSITMYHQNNIRAKFKRNRAQWVKAKALLLAKTFAWVELSTAAKPEKECL
ncbi:ATP-dependent RNA helicase DbpA [Striga asiatica]|uniref:ATP-dependent RNA helicase DbpA n=1 Tax=Striga asiatica TaxID=4170 RepID=A0A5A7Q8A5_STRAF|nr:ATP-dependent RNA helicase DbpA [Striga asiatica]